MNTKKKLILTGLAFIMMLLVSTPVLAAELPNKTVRVACGMNEMLYMNEDGEPEGIGLQYLRQLSWNKNWTLEYVEGSYNESLQRLYDGEIDLMLPVGDEDDPDSKLLYSDFNAGYQQIGLFAREEADIYYDDFTGFNHTRVGISIGSNSEILDNYAQENQFEYTKVPLNTTQDKITALQNGDVDMIAFSTLNDVEGGKLVAILEQAPFYICTTASNTELMDEINSSMSEIMVQTPEIASELYQAVLTGKTPISYTREENDKIESADTITFGVYGDRMPLAGVDKNGNCAGIYVDLLKEIAAASKLNIQIIPIKDDNKLYSYIDDGTVDFVVGMLDLRFSQENADNHLASNFLTSCATVAVTKPEYDLDQEKVETVALTRDRTYLESSILSWFPTAAIKYYDTKRECLDAVCSERANVTFLENWEYNYEVKNARYGKLIEWDSYSYVSGPTLGASRQSDLEILSILEKTIGKIPGEKVADIITQNVNSPYAEYTLVDRLYAARNLILVGSIFLFMIVVALTFYMKAKHKYIVQLEDANKAKSEFLSRMSHELRTPLNAILGYTEVLEGNLSTDAVDRRTAAASLKSIYRAVNYQLSIIGDLLDIQQLESGKIVMHSAEVDLGSYLESIVSMLKLEAEEKQVQFAFEKENFSKKSYILDGERLEQVLLNLLHNALKFTPAGGSVKLSAKIQNQDDKTDILTFDISDTGIGISEEFQKTKLFKRFAQEYGGNTSPYEGCGTGLEISREIAHRMGGEITCVSQKGVGSTFTVTIPAQFVEKKRNRDKKNQFRADLSGIRVLLCEDNKMNQDMESRLLKKQNCEVDIADDGLMGLEKFENSPVGYYQVTLMDIRMPNMDGWTCTRQIRALEREDALSVPILAVSANAFEEDIRHSLEVGMNEHLAKPIDVRVLTEKIMQYCTKEKQ